MPRRNLKELQTHHGFLCTLSPLQSWDMLCKEERVQREILLAKSTMRFPKFANVCPSNQSIHPDCAYLNGTGKWGRTRREKYGSTGSQERLLLPSCPTLHNVSLSNMTKFSW